MLIRDHPVTNWTRFSIAETLRIADLPPRVLRCWLTMRLIPAPADGWQGINISACMALKALCICGGPVINAGLADQVAVPVLWHAMHVPGAALGGPEGWQQNLFRLTEQPPRFLIRWPDGESVLTSSADYALLPADAPRTAEPVIVIDLAVIGHSLAVRAGRHLITLENTQ